ncbi:DUF6422 family protein [Saccharopolyspora sp. NPDC002686]|uniref:DUF6422 family protein n=1 Tax=Saccharopolyspora sp. NPDC002686 TaxID=3154541 RepID=UPI00331CD957
MMRSASDLKAVKGLTMSTFPNLKDLTDEQAEILDKAAALVINAKNEAAAMMVRAGLDNEWDDDGPFGSPCRVCKCPHYNGDGFPFRCSTVLSSGGTCGHQSSKHLFS